MGPTWRAALTRPAGWLPVCVSLALGLSSFAFSVGVDHRARTGHLEFADAADLHLVLASYPDRGIPMSFLSLANLRDAASATATPLGIASAGREYPGRYAGRLLSLTVEYQDPALTGFLGVEPESGRALQALDDQRGSELVALATRSLWRRLGEPPDLVGQRLEVQHRSVTIVGLAPGSFAGTLSGGIDLAMPLSAIEAIEQGDHLDNRSTTWLIGLLRSDAGPALAGELGSLGERLREIDPQANEGLQLDAYPLESFLLGDSAPQALRLLAAAATLVLAMCVANAALLLVSTVRGLAPALAIRRALGADRLTMLRLTVRLVAPPTLGAVAIAVLATRYVGPWLMRRAELAAASSVLDQPQALQLALVVASALVVFLLLWMLTWRAACAVPASSIVRGSAVGGLRRPVRSALNVAQLATSLVIVASALSAFGAVRQILAVDPGLDLRVIATRVVLEETAPEVAYARLLEGGSTPPGSRALAGPHLAPEATLSVVARRPGDSAERSVQLFRTAVSDAYFTLLDIELVEGRGFDSRDQAETTPVAVLSASAARRLSGERSPLSAEIVVEPPIGGHDRLSVIGVAADVKSRGPGNTGLSDDDLYVALRQAPETSLFVLDDPTRGIREPASGIAQALPSALLYPSETLASRFVRTSSHERFIALLTATFTCVALLVAAFGLLSSLRLQLHRQARALSIHRALGASSSRVARLLLASEARTVLAGIALGIVFAYFSGRLLSGPLRTLVSTRPDLIAASAVVVLLCSVIASVGPLVRASRLDPAEILKEE
ncbi:MAG: hypothetical protein DWQ36_24215 [Acidobacteria bacterium]|nr:MAG: hypothetical protein DWQ30_07410 [Acidobacteriota bacterium]REK00254.1 MAG: hypothetical protein DWQ36_24215 [Acidobacteriota bacterium]